MSERMDESPLITPSAAPFSVLPECGEPQAQVTGTTGDNLGTASQWGDVHVLPT